MASERSIYDRIDKIPDAWLRILPYLIVLIMLLYPIGLPISISTEVRNHYTAIESLETGEKILLSQSSGFNGYSEAGTGMVAIFKHLLKKGLKPIIWCGVNEAPVVMETIIEIVEPEKYGYVYGEDWAFFGFIAGLEAAYRAVATDFRGTLSVDYYGNSIDDLPVCDGIMDVNDLADICIDWNAGMEHIDYNVRQLAIPFNKKLLGTMSAANIGGLTPFYPEIYLGYLAAGGLAGGMYESLAGVPGQGLGYLDSLSMLTIAMFIIFIVTNIVDRGIRAQKARGEIS